MKYPVLFKVEVWDDADRYDYGAVMAEGYGDAAHQLEEYYGAELVSLSLFMCEAGPLFFDKETYDKIIEMPM